MIDRDFLAQRELLKIALEATDNYLAVEKKAIASNMVTNAMLHDFSYHMSRAHDALQQLGVLDKHTRYMQSHVETMLKLHGHKDTTIADLPYAHVPKADFGEIEEAVWDQAKERQNLPKEKLSSSSKAKAKARAKAAGRPYPNMVDNIWAARQQESRVVSFAEFLGEKKEINISEDDIEEMVEDLDWDDIVDLYDQNELVEENDDSDEEDEDEELEEALSVQARLKKRQTFARFKGRRGVARSLKLKRASDMSTLQRRARLAARRAIYKRFLKGRDKSQLSASEKDRIEKQVATLKTIQNTLAQRFMPKIRTIEQKRLAKARGVRK